MIEIDNLVSPSIDKVLFEWLSNNIPKNKTILELGSGLGTIELKKYWKVISIEHDENYLTIPNHHYIHAPLKEYKPIKRFPNYNIWYDAEIIKSETEDLSYDILLVDGPPGSTRIGLIKYHKLFNPRLTWVFDDAGRLTVREIIYRIASKLKKSYTVMNVGTEEKAFGVIWNDSNFNTNR